MTHLDIKRDLLPLKDHLFRLALRIVTDGREAEDIVQDVLVKIWEMCDTPTFREIQHLETYAMTMTRNMALDRLEQQRLRYIPLYGRTQEGDEDYEAQSLHEDIADNAALPDQRMEHDERRLWMQRLLSELPEKQRTILQLRDVEERTYQEIGEIMQIGESDVKVTLHRARQALKRIITERKSHGL